MTEEKTSIKIHKPSFNERIFFLISGAIMSVPLTLFITQFADPFLSGFSNVASTLISVAVLAPLIEEFSKIYPLFYRHGETQRSIFNLALLVGLGFGIVEFFTYVFGLGTNPINRIPGLFFHPASTSISAYGIAVGKPFQFYAFAVLLHFANNFLAVTNPYPVPTSLIIVLITVFTSYKLYNNTKEKFIDLKCY